MQSCRLIVPAPHKRHPDSQQEQREAHAAWHQHMHVLTQGQSESSQSPIEPAPQSSKKQKPAAASPQQQQQGSNRVLRALTGMTVVPVAAYSDTDPCTDEMRCVLALACPYCMQSHECSRRQMGIHVACRRQSQSV